MPTSKTVDRSLRTPKSPTKKTYIYMVDKNNKNIQKMRELTKKDLRVFFTGLTDVQDVIVSAK